MSKRTFEFSEGTSNKFWEIWVEGVEVHTRYGKIGTEGSSGCWIGRTTKVSGWSTPSGATSAEVKKALGAEVRK